MLLLLNIKLAELPQQLKDRIAQPYAIGKLHNSGQSTIVTISQGNYYFVDKDVETESILGTKQTSVVVFKMRKNATTS